MRPMLFVTAAFAAAAIAPVVGCSTVEPSGGAPMPLVNSAGQSIGTVRAWQTAGGVSFHISASGLPHGLHGLHVTLAGVWLATMLAQVQVKGFRPEIVHRLICFNLFWHALDIVWIGIFTIVYLIGAIT